MPAVNQTCLEKQEYNALIIGQRSLKKQGIYTITRECGTRVFGFLLSEKAGSLVQNFSRTTLLIGVQRQILLVGVGLQAYRQEERCMSQKPIT